MKNVATKERRLFTRFPVRIFLKYFNLDLLGEVVTQCTNDISARGICILTNEELRADTPLDIWLQMPDNGEQLYIQGKVVWSNMIGSDKYRLGVNLENAELNPILLALKTINVRIKHH
ncbi:MAG: PilZ domain-containing protein [Candidatus Omnitrophota bacterium]